MDSMEHLRQTLEYYRQQRQRKLDDYRSADLLVRQLEKELGEPSTSEVEVSPALPGGTIETVVANPRNPDVRPDEFYGMSQSDAAKTHLRKINRAISFDQLVEALRKGGAQLGGADPKRTLYVSLARNPLREFVYPQEGFIGLREFYPNLPKALIPRELKKSKRRVRAKTHRSTRKAARSAHAGADPGKRNVPATVHRIMEDGHPHSSEEIFQAVESELGAIKKIEIFGALRSKEFVKDQDGKYRLGQLETGA